MKENTHAVKILDYCEKVYSGSFRFLKEKNFRKAFGDTVYNELIEYTSYLPDIPLPCRVYSYCNGYAELPTCKICSGAVAYSSNKGWLTYCSNQCRGKDKNVTIKKQNTNLERYGSTNYLASKEGTEQRKQSNLERWGAENFMQSECK